MADDYASAAADDQQAPELCRNLGDRRGQAWALSGLGDVQRLTGDYPATTASFQQALAVNQDPSTGTPGRGSSTSSA
jgi:hypothetical protein